MAQKNERIYILNMVTDLVFVITVSVQSYHGEKILRLLEYLIHPVPGLQIRIVPGSDCSH